MSSSGTTNGAPSEPSPPVTPGILRVGVELELLLTVPPGEQQLRNDLIYKTDKPNLMLARWVEEKYNEWRKANPKAFEIELDFKEEGINKGPGYTKWTITQDRSIQEKRSNLSFGLEFVSPIMFVGMNTEWFAYVSKTITDFYGFLENTCKFTLEPEDSCGTHVHVSPVQWTRTRIERVAFASFWFEEAIRMVLEEKRRANFFTKEFRHPKVIGGFNLANIIPSKDEEKKPWVNTSRVTTADLARSLRDIKSRNLTTQQLVELINPKTVPNREQIMRHQTAPVPEFDRYYGWNFNNLVFDKAGNVSTELKGSVEFRRPARSHNAKYCLSWIHLVVAFTLAACYHGDVEELASTYPRKTIDKQPENLTKYKTTVKSLREFLNAPKPPKPANADPYAYEANWKNANSSLDAWLESAINEETGFPELGLGDPTIDEIVDLQNSNDWMWDHPDDHVGADMFAAAPVQPIPPKPL
ncbi:MAG: hypothetical protein M1831_006651 [Alyxoria varia]|nr:MAG: hypothetical protein M1831_006651 [Alyxoria varia]